MAGSWLFVAVASGGLLRVLQAVSMSGEPLERALGVDTLSSVPSVGPAL